MNYETDKSDSSTVIAMLQDRIKAYEQECHKRSRESREMSERLLSESQRRTMDELELVILERDDEIAKLKRTIARLKRNTQADTKPRQTQVQHRMADRVERSETVLL